MPSGPMANDVHSKIFLSVNVHFLVPMVHLVALEAYTYICGKMVFDCLDHKQLGSWAGPLSADEKPLDRP